jgi:hypothetical protein
MTAIPIKVHIIVDPCGRVLVHEAVRYLPGEDNNTDDLYPMNQPSWYQRPGCVEHTVTIDVPVPHITTPRLTFSQEVARQ